MSYVICDNCDMICEEYKEWRIEGNLITLAQCIDCKIYYDVKTSSKVQFEIPIEKFAQPSSSTTTKTTRTRIKPRKRERRSSIVAETDSPDIFHQQHLVEEEDYAIGFNYSDKKTGGSLLASSLDNRITGFHIGEINVPINAISKAELVNQSLSKLISLSNPQNGTTNKTTQKMKSLAQKFFFASDYEFLLCLPALHFTPYDFQLSGPQQILGEMNGRGILADEVGLGKTLQAGMVLKELILREIITSCLILVPTSLKNQWEEELFEKFDLTFAVADSAKDLQYLLRTKKFIIASLHLFSRNKDDLSDIETDFLIVDEAHRLRNKGTNLYKGITRIRSNFRLLVTATPFQNNLSELYNLVNILRPGALGNWSQFRKRFIKTDFKKDTARLNLLRGIVRKYVIRRRRKSLDLDIPNRSARTIRLKANAEENELSRITEEYIMRITQNDASNLKGIRGLLMCSLLRRATSSANAIGTSFENAILGLEKRNLTYESRGEVEELLESGIDRAIEMREKANSSKLKAVFKELSSSDNQLIIFSEFKATTYWLSKELQLNGFEATHFHGGLTSSKRYDLVKDFWENKSQVFVSTDAGSEGLNLQVANRVMNYDLPWNPMRIEQRIGRVHRLTQKREVEVINLVVNKSIEQRVLDKVLYKIGLFEDVIGGLDEIVGMVTNSNLEKSEDALQYLILQNYVKSITDEEKSWDHFDTALESIGDKSAEARREIEKIDREIDELTLEDS